MGLVGDRTEKPECKAARTLKPKRSITGSFARGDVQPPMPVPYSPRGE